MAEDQMLLRVGLTRILEAGGISVVAAVGRRRRTRTEALTRNDLDVAIVDVRLPPTFTTEGLEAVVEGTLGAGPACSRSLVLSQYVEPLYARELLASRDRIGRLPAQGPGGRRRRVRGRRAPGRRRRHRARPGGGGRTARAARPLDRLTDREREVLTLMAEGRSNAAIATRLYVTEKAVDKHINNIFTKLDLPPAPDDNRRVLAVLAWLEGR